ncbi:unnamed protein product [Ambrosiozyma monospora]|uniref:Unnamed protein product n=1 Tax=Ambrosiozyma monospora TaxID=43982 RepID=A0A9W6Z0T6_AMBMO|nr:unnamed protein product [Ambrosiozyma monospora]
MLKTTLNKRFLHSSSRVLSARNQNTFKVFDRNVKLLQRDRAATDKDSHHVEYIRDEVARRMIERMAFLKSDFSNVLDLGCNSGNLERQLCTNHPDDDPRWREDKELVKSKIKKLYMADSSKDMLFKDMKSSFNNDLNLERIVADEEAYDAPLLQKENEFDVVISNLSLHWINNLPGVFNNIYHSLKPDSCFIGSMFGGDTLFELRTSLQLAEMERMGGLSPRVSPFVGSNDVGGLMQKAGFQMLTIDVEEIIVDYPNVVALMKDLQLMGESNSILSSPPPLTKDMLIALEPIYRSLHGDPETGHLPATFRFVFMIGWKPGKYLSQPAMRGSANISLGDALEDNKER